MVIVGAVVLAVSFFGTRAQGGLRGFRAIWVSVAVIVFNTLLGFLLLNLAVAAGLRVTDRLRTSAPATLGRDFLGLADLQIGVTRP
ncbi:MAG TPA: hypothetical protein VFC23_07705, partial [Thermoanaerobaculia bacterium]|nr:hypothetical protein [Thermoanaerobaculia bacterium]